MPSTAPARPRTRPHAGALLPALAAALLAVPAAASAASHGVQRLRATRHVTAGVAARRGLTVEAVVARSDHALRLTLTRRGEVVARRTFRLRRGGRVTVRWHVRRLGAGRYLLRARSGRSGRSLRGRARRAQVLVRRSTTAPAPTTTAPTTTRAPTAISAASPCGTRAPRAPVRHVVWVVFENKKYEQVIGSPNAPTFNALARQCGLATAFSAETHPSLPNYVAMTSGGTQGITDDSGPSSHRLSVPSIFSQVGDWRALQEDMPSNCDLGNTGTYAARHNPATYYADLTGCAQRDVPLGPRPDLSARFTFVTPNLCHDMHSCPTQSDSTTEVRTGDAWLASFLPEVVATPEYASGSTVVFLTFDESEGGSSQQVPTFVISPSTPRGARSGAPFTHSSLLRTTEELLGVAPYLGAAASAPSMRAAFGL
jgi:phosphatidylinositol-3-phosphatase